ncbi:MAG TPA: ABC transporter ATP-binding protein [Solirubrobacterales bacterium]
MRSRTGPVENPIRALILRRKARLGWAGLLLFLHEVGEVGVPIVIGLAIDDALSPPDLGRLVLWLVILGADFLMLSLTWRFGSREAARVRYEIAHDLRLAVVDRVLDGRGIAAARARPSGETLTIAVSDARRIGDAVRACLSGVTALVILLAAVVAVAIVSPLLAAVVVPGGVLTVVVIALLSRPVETRSHVEQEANARTASLAVDLVAGLRVLAGLRAGATAGARYREVSSQAVGSSIRAAEATALVDGIAALAVGLYLAAVAWVSAELALHGHISVGTVIAVLGVSQLMIEPLQDIAQAVPAARRGRASSARIEALLGAPMALGGDGSRQDLPGADGSAPLAAYGDLAIEALRAPGLDGIDLTLRAGTLHGVVSESPLSAESLVRALAGEAEPDGGRVALGGVDLADAAPRARREAVLAWLHKEVPPGETIAEMVGGQRPRAGDAIAAVEAAAATEILDRIPGGWDAPVSERGASLSGGERQRLALARVLAERPPILVMHEPTSALDAVTELAIAHGFARSRHGLTTLLITTSPTLLAACDEVSLIVDGRVVESGPHNDLIARDRYREAIGR